MFQDWGYGVKHHFHQYFSYIVVVSFIGEETGVPEENHQPSQVTDKLEWDSNPQV